MDKWNIWDRKKHKGYSTVPRTLNYINRIIDCLSGTGVPVSQTYLSLWCRVFDEVFVEIRDKNDIAYESGFSGQRAVTTWLSRMKKLRELGFIKTKGGTSGEFQYVLMMNPLYVIKQIYDSGRLTKDERYMALFSRMKEVGAKWE
ncbi:hypothetical protein QE177_11515 [Arsenophonus sp. aPb]|uniref:hypothetical protein n=1 Tax=Arsenophonus sp. aPb TaxID=3041619 RepID=UPI0024685E2D|nr:hypothetical protein [Arsenophonus sp. aPb]WGL97818.1 hypothetical protein QE177_11515 [Arsenophonus sp. aPb]